MKTSYPYAGGHIRSGNPKQPLKKAILFFLFILLTILALAENPPYRPDFKDAELISGAPGADGALYRFPRVESNVDAIVRIKQRSSPLVYLVTIDMKSSGVDNAWQPRVGQNNGSAIRQIVKR